MSDLIDRQAAIEAICAACPIDTYYKCDGYQEGSEWCEYTVALRKLPSAQPDIVRCRDCKYHDDEEPGAVYCPDRVGGWVSEDFFCADGERRT